jgi:hypothetical protein
VIKAEVKIVNTSKIPKETLLSSSRLSTYLEMYKRENLDIQELNPVFFPTHQDSIF